MDQIFTSKTTSETQSENWNLLQSLCNVHGSVTIQERMIEVDGNRVFKQRILPPTSGNNTRTICVSLLGHAFHYWDAGNGVTDAQVIASGLKDNDFVTIPYWMRSTDWKDLIFRFIPTWRYNNQTDINNGRIIFATKDDEDTISASVVYVSSTKLTDTARSMSWFDRDGFRDTVIANGNIAIVYSNSNTQAGTDQEFYFSIEKTVASQSVIAPQETHLATGQHVVGELITLGNELFKATKAIAPGDVITDCSVPTNIASELMNNVPSYYSDHIASKALEFAMAERDVIDNNIRFAFITDTHLRNANGTLTNACNSPALLKYLCDNANLGMIVFGGDAITGSYASQNAAMKDIMFFRHVFSPVWDKMYCIFGNHEYGNNSSSIQALTMAKIYGVIEQDKEMKYKTIEQGHYIGSYIIDNDVKKVRMIFINLNSGTNIHPQVNFFTSQLQSMPSGYTAVIFTHFTIERTNSVDAIDSKLTREDSIVPVVNAYMNRGTYNGVDFSNCDGSVAAIIGGHCHFDSMVKTETGVPVISTTCDKFNTAADGYDRTPGTIGEQAFDLYTINTSSKTIDIIRVGAGNNRSFTYGSLPEN